MADSAQITLTFPDGASRNVKKGATGLEVAKGISPSLAKRTVAVQLNGALADLADPINADAKIRFIARTDPEALELIRHDCRARDGGGRAVAVARHPGDHRPGDRKRLLLRLRQGRAVPARGHAEDRKEDGGDHRQKRAVHQGSLVARQGQGDLRRDGRGVQGRAGGRDSGRSGHQDLQAGRVV